MGITADIRATEDSLLNVLVGTRPFGYWHLENLQAKQPKDCVQTGR